MTALICGELQLLIMHLLRLLMVMTLRPICRHVANSVGNGASYAHLNVVLLLLRLLLLLLVLGGVEHLAHLVLLLLLLLLMLMLVLAGELAVRWGLMMLLEMRLSACCGTAQRRLKLLL